MLFTFMSKQLHVTLVIVQGSFISEKSLIADYRFPHWLIVRYKITSLLLSDKDSAIIIYAACPKGRCNHIELLMAVWKVLCNSCVQQFAIAFGIV